MLRSALVVLAAGCLAAADPAAAQAPRRPPEPFAVFVETVETGETERDEELREVEAVVRDRVRRRGNWFRLAEDREQAALTLRITNYRRVQRMIPKLERLILNGQVQMVERSEIIEVHYVDALAAAPRVAGLRESLTGLDEREQGPSLRNAAGHLAEQLEDFVKEHYEAVTGSGPPSSPGLPAPQPQ